MAEYIEREALLKFIENGLNNPDSAKAFGYDAVEIMTEVQYAPAADVVPVVRCKDCEHFAEAKGKDSGKPCGYGQCKLPTGVRGIVFADDFCSFGERRGEDE